MAFEPRRSDLPLQVAFPILLANLTGELLGGSTAPTEAVDPGTPVNLAIPAGASGLTVTAPDGSAAELVPGTADATDVTFAGTSQPGIYVATPKLAPGSSAAPSSSAGSGATAGPLATPTGSRGVIGASAGASGPPDDPMAPIRFAVDLFDVNESTIAPGSAAAIEALGVGNGTAGAKPSAATGGSPEPAPATSTEPATSRDELWVPIVLLVLVALCAEWALYHRDTLVRIRRSLGARLGRRPAESGG
jgi:hypothetical protein